MKNKLSIYVLLLLSCACARVGNNETDSDVIVIPMDNMQKHYELTDVDSVSFISLEGNEESFLGSIVHLKYKNGRYYLLDDFRKALYIYNCDGTYYGKIEKIGVGPGEYTEITDFSLSSDEIGILDNVQQRFHFFDLDGKYINSTSNSKDGWGHYCIYAGEQLYMINEWSRSKAGYYHLFAYTKEGFKKYLPFTKDDTDRIIGYFCATENNDSVLIHISSLDALYRLTSNDCFLEYKIDYQGKNLPDEYKQDDLITLLKKGVAKDYVLGLDRLAEDRKNIYLMFSFKDDRYVAVYDKNSGCCNLYDSFSWNDMSFSRLSVTDDNYIVNLSAHDFIVYHQYIWKENIKDKELLRRIEKVATEISAEDNGVILLFHRKK